MRLPEPHLLAPSAKTKDQAKLKKRLKGFKPYLYIPALFSLGFWIYKPLVETFRLSLYEWNLANVT